MLSEDREPAPRRVPRTLLVILLIQAGLSLLYRLVSSGPANSGYGSFGSQPSTFLIWQRT